MGFYDVQTELLSGIDQADAAQLNPEVNSSKRRLHHGNFPSKLKDAIEIHR